MSESTDSIAKHCDRGQETILRVPFLYGDIHGFLDGKLLSRSKKKKRFRCEMDALNTRNFRDHIDEKWKQIYGTGWILFSIFLPFLFSFPFLLNSDVLTNERHLGIDKKRKNQRAKGGSDFFCQDEEGEREWIVRMHQVEHACTFISV